MHKVVQRAPRGPLFLEDGTTAAKRAEGVPRRSEVPRHLLAWPSPWRLVRYALEDWGIILLAWIGMTYTSGVLYPLWAIIIGGRMHAFGVTLHDLCHMRFRGRTVPGTLVEILCGFPIATTMLAMRFHHIRHHRDANLQTDPYFKQGVRKHRWLYVLQWVRFVLFVPGWTVRAVYGSIAYFAPGLRNSYGRIFLQDRSGRDLRQHREVLACARAEWGQLAFQAGVVAFAWIMPEVVLYYYFIPVTLAALFCGYRLLVEHTYERAEDRSAVSVMRTTRDHGLNPLSRALFAPRNIGYHVAHHLHPQVALEGLPALRAWYRERYPNMYQEL